MKKLLLTSLFSLFLCLVYSQTTIINEQFTATPPTGWLYTSSGWATNNYGASNARSGAYALKISSWSSASPKYIYIPISVQNGYTYTITFWTKRICSVTINVNETTNQTTLLQNSTYSNTNCSSNFSNWYQWSNTYVSTFTGTAYYQILATSAYFSTTLYIDDVSIFESEPVDLPIELLYFKGSKYNSDNILHWSTASEDNNDYFTIEKTKDGIDWEIVSKKPGAGNSSNQLYYSSVDENVESIINYYRLKQTDYDGRFKYSEIISIDNRNNREIKEVVKITNILGQEVDLQYYRGLVIIYYTDGSSNKMIK